MSKIDNSKLLSKFLTKGDIANLDELISAVERNEMLVTCMGLYNHGKSTLLNALIKDFEDNTFKTADIRETTVSKKIKYNDITYVDTPGLNAKKHDDKRVMDAVKKSDLNLFVHTVTTGEFVEKEIEFLNTVKKHWKNPKEFISRTVFVISRIDKAQSQDDIEKATEKMNQQIVEIFDCKPIIAAVSATRYLKGNLDNKKVLIKKSNIETLEKKIYDKKNELINSIKKTKIERLENQYVSLTKRLNSKIQENTLKINEQKRIQKKYEDSLNIEVKKVEKTLESMYSKLGE